MKKLKITRYADPGHSWFKVERKLLTDLGIEEKISSFSYQLGNYVYLEEDCDIAIFFKAYLKTDNLSWEMMTNVAEITEKHTNKRSKVRSYPSFKAGFKPVTEWKDGLNVKLYGKSYVTSSFNDVKVIISPEGAKFRINRTQLSELELDNV